MSEKFKLSLPAAVLININIMLGAGIFLNSITLSKMAGLLGAAVYLIVGIIMLPLVLSIAQLLKIHPAGSFYTFGAREINPITGFLSIWTYFVAKLASSTLMIHFFSKIVQGLIPAFNGISAITLDIIIISLFTVLNMFNLKAGSRIQYMFMIFKAVPILFVILSGIFLFTTHNIVPENIIWSGFFTSIPLVIYAFTGFESACSLSRHIKNPDKNAPKAIMISYGLVILILFTFQFLFYSVLGPQIAKAVEYFEIFPALLNVIMHSQLFKFKLQAILQLAIASSALGGAYGILFSNNWNLYALVENKHVFFPNLLGKLNKYKMPFVCIIIESLICVAYLMLTNGEKIPLQQISAFGSTIAYSISSLALLFACLRDKSKVWLPVLALFNCAILLILCIKGFFESGTNLLPLFVGIIVFGIVMFKSTAKNNHTNITTV